jgi:lipid II:glycine glycyltransferase (peptidoglycan interpeptide bridge formation enzyme)
VGWDLGVESAVRHAEWDGFVASTAGGDIIQTSSWARFRATAGYACERLVLRHDGTISGGAQVYVGRSGPWKVAYVPYGPLIAHGVPRSAAARLVAALGRSASRSGAVFVQPPLHGEHLAAQLSEAGFSGSEIRVAPSASLRLDVGRPLDDLTRGLSRSMRERTRQWPRLGVEVREGTRDDLGLLADLHARSAGHRGFDPLSLRYLESLWDALAPDGLAFILVGTVEGQAVAADLLSSFAGVVTGRIHGFDRESPHAKARVPAALVWSAIVRSHDHGERWLDFGGIKRAAAIALLDGQRHHPAISGRVDFKLAFGANPVLYPAALEHIGSGAVRSGLRFVRSFDSRQRILRGARERLRRGASGRPALKPGRT